MQSKLSPLRNAGLYVTVFLTGASVMVIELLGTRMIAPFYGASLYVWSSLISVTMIALAIGYFVGGYWADRARRMGLSLIIAMAGLCTLMIPLATRPVLLATDPLGLRLGAFISSLVLFLPGLVWLGMVGPFAIKRATVRLDGVGTSSGSIYAVSTLGSVIGTLTLGFYLFPLVGSRQIFLGVGILLLLLAVVFSLFEQRQLGKSLTVLPALVLLVAGCLLVPKGVEAGHGAIEDGKFRLRSEHESLYGWVRVIDQPGRDLRMLTSDASMIGAASISSGEGRLSYQDIVGMIPALAPKMKKALIIGLGAGHMSQVLRDRYGLVTDTLEIDPAVAEAARRYFGYQPSGRSLVGDARYEIRHLQGPYDLIIHDCFTGGSEPSHLLTVETLRQLKGLLSEQGILAVNFVGFAGDSINPPLASVARTIEQVFPELSIFVSEPGEDFNDFIFLAASRPLDLTSPSLLPGQSGWLRSRLYTVDVKNGQLLTDNLNPLEHLQIRKSEHYRHFLVEWLGSDLLMR